LEVAGKVGTQFRGEGSLELKNYLPIDSTY
jgi:hypothetical protein